MWKQLWCIVVIESLNNSSVMPQTLVKLTVVKFCFNTRHKSLINYENSVLFFILIYCSSQIKHKWGGVFFGANKGSQRKNNWQPVVRVFSSITLKFKISILGFNTYSTVTENCKKLRGTFPQKKTASDK